jgi:hypothetical protein
MTKDKTTKCPDCGKDVHPLAVFPEGRCLECYKVATANDPMPTADDIVRMWGGPVRRRRR